MSLIELSDGWVRFGNGRRWRTRLPSYLVEVDQPRNTPNYLQLPQLVTRMRRVKAFYRELKCVEVLDGLGTGVDILVANAFTESLGTVPSPLSQQELRQVYASASEAEVGKRLHQVVLRVARDAKYLERREPGYVDPVATPHRVSLGSHHVLISTALELIGAPRTGLERTATIVDLVCRLPADTPYAAELAVKYFLRSQAQHRLQPPLLAAVYNAGSLRPDPDNPWNLKQYGDHLDRWVAFFNTSRSL